MRVDLTGCKFGKLTVMALVRENLNHIYWSCTCDCGKENVIVEGYRLKKGIVSSCGCDKEKTKVSRATSFENLVGKRYGKLLIIEFYKIENGDTFWLCKCDCGNEKIASRHSMVRNRTTSCGCAQKEHGKRQGKKNGEGFEYGEASLNCLYHKYQQQASRRGLPFTLTRDEFKDITSSNCFYCGKPPSNCIKTGNKSGEYSYSGIDRLDNDIGYTLENCVPCCIECNYSKHTRTILEFAEWVEQVYFYFAKDFLNEERNSNDYNKSPD